MKISSDANKSMINQDRMPKPKAKRIICHDQMIRTVAQGT